MKKKKLMKFLLKMDRKKPIIYVGILVLIVFTFSQCMGFVHFPVKSQEDIDYLSQKDCSALYVKCSNKEIYKNIKQYLNKYSDYVDKEEKQYFLKLIKEMEANNQYFEEMYDIVAKENQDYMEQVAAFKDCCTQKIGTFEQIRKNTVKLVKENGYLSKEYELMLSVTMIILMVIVLPIVLQAVAEDKQCQFSDILGCCNLDKNQYLLMKIIAYFIPFWIAAYFVGLAYNIATFIKFKISGFHVYYHPFIGDYMLYIVITSVFLILLVTFATQRVKHSTFIIPFYFLYFIFNISQTGDGIVKELLRCVVRLDFYHLGTVTLIFNRLLYIGLAILLFTRILKFEKGEKT